MIISASRRTDIPALHFPWFLDRVRAGYVDVPNPFNIRAVRRVSLLPEDADLVVFWTKDSRPMHRLLPEFETRGIPYMFLYTLTPYGRDIEPGIRDKDGVVSAFRELADRIGPERISWRYDPIILGPGMTPECHIRWFDDLARRLEGSALRCITSFVEPYRRVRRRLASLGSREPSPEERIGLLAELASAAASRGMILQTCADGTDSARPCIDGELASRIAGRNLDPRRDPHQRPACLCAMSADIGTYGTCTHGCVYCYAGGISQSPPDMLSCMS